VRSRAGSMRRLSLGVLGALLAFGAACVVHGPCCNSGDCISHYICSSDCATADGGALGICIPPCAVDLDCEKGSICQNFNFNCGCVAAPSGVGNCGAGDGGYH
jgi:hypothetical protein